MFVAGVGELMVAVALRRGAPLGGDKLDGGKFLAWCEQAPQHLEADGQPLPFAFDQASGKLSATVTPVIGSR